MINKAKGYVVYEGKSRLSDDPIVTIITMASANDKTGNMVQLWILPADQTPLEALKSDRNQGACGTCLLQGKYSKKLKKMINRVCYVRVYQAPDSIFRSWKRGIYPTYDRSKHARKIRGRELRFGAYGDPAALPIEVLEHLEKLTSGHTGYSHQIFDIAKTDPQLADDLAQMLMVSCDTNEQHDQATANGWRTFTVVPEGGATPENAVECPHYTHDVQCKDCLLCSGSKVNAKSVYVYAHAKTGLNLPKIQALTIGQTSAAA